MGKSRICLFLINLLFRAKLCRGRVDFIIVMGDMRRKLGSHRLACQRRRRDRDSGRGRGRGRGRGKDKGKSSCINSLYHSIDQIQD